MRNKAEILRNAARRATLRGQLSAELAALTAELTALGSLAAPTLTYDTCSLSGLRDRIEWAKKTIATLKLIRAVA